MRGGGYRLQRTDIIAWSIRQQVMSVKDKIAMWNSMATAPNPPPPVAQKLVVSTGNAPGGKEQPKEKAPQVKNEIPQGFKKTQSVDHPPPPPPTHTEQTSSPFEKPKPMVNTPVVQKKETKENPQEQKPHPPLSNSTPSSVPVEKPKAVLGNTVPPPPIESKEKQERPREEKGHPILSNSTPPPSIPAEKIKPVVVTAPPSIESKEKKEKTQEEKGGLLQQPGKFSDIKKQLQAQTAGKGIYFAPPPPKKVEIIVGDGGGGECQVQRDVPRFSVKEQAAKLALFYQQKKLNELKKKQEEEAALNDHHETPPPSTQPTVPVPAQNCLNITPPSPPKQETVLEATNLQIRPQKNKKKWEQFDEDD